jgi:hypothetical protein
MTSWGCARAAKTDRRQMTLQRGSKAAPSPNGKIKEVSGGGPLAILKSENLRAIDGRGS